MKEDSRNLVVKMKKLQDFHDKYDTILQDERNASQKLLITINEEKESTERKLKKELDESQTELETLQGE